MVSNKPKPNQVPQGHVQVFTGDGRGKTSAAVGTVARASGYGLRTYVVFFTKREHKLGEYKTLTLLPNVEWVSCGLGKLFSPSNVTNKDRELANKALGLARQAIKSNKYDLVVLDEINPAAHWNLIEAQDIIKLVKEKPLHVNIIITGRYADPKLLGIADLVTEMKNIRHPWDSGIKGYRGIDY